MCVPLILQNKLALAESYVTGHNHLEQQLVTLLDSWCHPSFRVEEISEYETCVNVRQPAVCTQASLWRCMNSLCLHVCVSTGGSRTSLWTNSAWARSSPKYSPNMSSDWWRNTTLIKVCDCVLFMHVCTPQPEMIMILSFWLRTLSPRSAQEEIGLSTFPHVQEVCGGKWCRRPSSSF